jgi:hypothetical protein
MHCIALTLNALIQLDVLSDSSLEWYEAKSNLEQGEYVVRDTPSKSAAQTLLPCCGSSITYAMDGFARR